MRRSCFLGACVLLVLCACHTAVMEDNGGRSQTNAESIFRRFSACLAEARFHDAFLLMDEIAYELRNNQEDPAGQYEYSELLLMTSVHGETDWPKILKDPEIPLEWKLDLVKDIHVAESENPSSSGDTPGSPECLDELTHGDQGSLEEY